MTPSEALVHKLCQGSFLSLWSFASPIRHDKKELCDVLIVFGEHVVILSVKECAIGDSGDDATDVRRWHKKAVDGSVHQIYGAERYLRTSPHVITSAGEVHLALPPVADRQVHRIAVALGSDQRVLLSQTDFGKGFVHVFDERALEILFIELDTVADFVHYLVSKEQFFGRARVTCEGSEDDLLAFYLQEGRKFPEEIDHLLLAPGLWEEHTKNPQARLRKEADKVSYFWDQIVEKYAGHLAAGDLMGDSALKEVEVGLRYMAGEKRFNRRILGQAFVGVVCNSDKVGTRTVLSPSGVRYVFAVRGRHWPRASRAAELASRCLYLRQIEPSDRAIVGLATEPLQGAAGMSYDLAVAEHQMAPGPDLDELMALGREQGWFGERTTAVPFHADEFPEAPKPQQRDKTRAQKATQRSKAKRKAAAKARKRNR